MNLKTIALVGLAAIVLSTTAHAHEFIVKPAKSGKAADEPLRFTVESTHYFVRSEEMEKADTVTVSLAKGGALVPVKLQENEAAQRLEGTLSDVDSTTAYLLGHRHGQIWSQTDKGWQPGGREQNPDAKTSNKYEKFAKALINASADDDSYAKPVGQLLEIVPLTNPATLSAGDELPVQVLYDGKPLETSVYATFDGFSDAPNTYAFYTETLSEGEHADKAMIKLWSPGTWMVRAEHRVSSDEFDEHVMRAVLLFEVPESS